MEAKSWTSGIWSCARTIYHQLGQAAVTVLSAMVNGAVSHDKITRFLSEREYTSKDLWLEVKSAVRQIEADDDILIFDSAISEKSWTDGNDVVCWAGERQSSPPTGHDDCRLPGHDA